MRIYVQAFGVDLANRQLGGTTPSVLGFGALTAVVMGTYHYTGAALTGYKKDKEIDEFERKQFLRKNRRVPIEQTVAELGEGRGMNTPEQYSFYG